MVRLCELSEQEIKEECIYSAYLDPVVRSISRPVDILVVANSAGSRRFVYLTGAAFVGSVKQMSFSKMQIVIIEMRLVASRETNLANTLGVVHVLVDLENTAKRRSLAQ